MIETVLPHVFRASPNFNERRGGNKISIVVLHYTGMASAQKACEWLCNPQSQVSSHYLIDEHGRITQMVGEESRAWHAGVSSWHGKEDINSLSIGIEIQNLGHGPHYHDFPLIQMETVAKLTFDIAKRHNILSQNILAHSDVAPGRKVDPGEKFDWAYLHRKGVGHWIKPEALSGGSFLQEGDTGDPVSALQALLKMYGYGIEVTSKFDKRTRVVVEAFQRHFRQERVDGIADVATIATLHKLLRQKSA